MGFISVFVPCYWVFTGFRLDSTVFRGFIYGFNVSTGFIWVLVQCYWFFYRVSIGFDRFDRVLLGFTWWPRLCKVSVPCYRFFFYWVLRRDFRSSPL